MVANLHQNPQKRPIVGHRLPTLLRQGCMWLLLNQDKGLPMEERWLLPSDTWKFLKILAIGLGNFNQGFSSG